METIKQKRKNWKKKDAKYPHSLLLPSKTKKIKLESYKKKRKIGLIVWVKTSKTDVVSRRFISK
jgi:hypothetical protein